MEMRKMRSSNPDTYYGLKVKRQYQAIKNDVDTAKRWTQNKRLLVAICEEAEFDELLEFLEDGGWDELGKMGRQAHDEFGDRRSLKEQRHIPDSVTIEVEL